MTRRKPFERRNSFLYTRQFGRERNTDSNPRVRRSANADAQYNLQYNQRQFAADENGLTSLKLYSQRLRQWDTLPMHGHYTGGSSPTARTESGSLTLEFTANDQAYFAWHRSDKTDTATPVYLHTHWWAVTGQVTDVTVSVESFFRKHGELASGTADVDDSQTFDLLTPLVMEERVFAVQPEDRRYDEIHWRITVDALTTAGGSSLQLVTVAVGSRDYTTHAHD
jgi:hypothetical protein